MIPERLKKGDTIALVAPSKPVVKIRQCVEDFAEKLKELELNVKYAPNCFEVDKYGASAGTPQQRADDINDMFKDNSVDAIWCVQGGSGAIEVLRYLDFGAIKQNPKIFLGKSDIDLLSMTINKMTGLVTFHGPDSKINGGKLEFDPEYTQRMFRERLMEGKIGEVEKSSEWKCVRAGKAKGKIMGCNLNTILKLAGTKYFPDFTDCILFLESYQTGVERLIFKLEQLREIGVFDRIKGIVVGYIYGFQDDEEFIRKSKTDKDGNRANYEDIVAWKTRDYDFPILKINEFGHYSTHAFFPIGGQVEMDAEAKSLKIVEECVK